MLVLYHSWSIRHVPWVIWFESGLRNIDFRQRYQVEKLAQYLWIFPRGVITVADQCASDLKNFANFGLQPRISKVFLDHCNNLFFAVTGNKILVVSHDNPTHVFFSKLPFWHLFGIFELWSFWFIWSGS